MLRMQAIASGSNGNCIYVGEGNTHVLIDVGISCRRVKDGLEALGVDPGTLSGIFITHEHWDHVQGLYVFSSKYKVPIYATDETISCIRYQDKGNKIAPELYHPVKADQAFTIGCFNVLPVPTHHDAVNPVAYRLNSAAHQVGVLTDTGITDAHMRACFQNTEALLLESNHDVRMVEAGSYPYALKRRILGRNGHLSNAGAAEFIQATISPALQVLLLGHLSEENNMPELALLEMEECIGEIPSEKKSGALIVKVAGRYESSDVFSLNDH